MAELPRCKRLRRSCRELDVTIRIADLESETRNEQDAAATWILGHHERVTFGRIYSKKSALLVDATIHVPCRHLVLSSPNGDTTARASCTAYGFEGAAPKHTRGEAPDLAAGDGVFTLVRKGRRTAMPLKIKNGAGREKPGKNGKRDLKKGKTLPVIAAPNPCAEALCHTSDNKRGAACCRDLKLDLLLPRKAENKVALLRHRKSPYLCKVNREDKRTMEVEIISACGYLDTDGVSCVLHDRVRPNGKSAKPQLCYDWPDFGKDETGHRGCVFA